MPPWPKFLRGCLKYREALERDREALERERSKVPVHDAEFE